MPGYGSAQNAPQARHTGTRNTAKMTDFDAAISAANDFYVARKFRDVSNRKLDFCVLLESAPVHSKPFCRCFRPPAGATLFWWIIRSLCVCRRGCDRLPALSAPQQDAAGGGSAPPDVLEPVTDCDVVGYEQDSVTILLQVRRVTLPTKQDYKMVISRGRLIDYSVDIIHCSLSCPFCRCFRPPAHPFYPYFSWLTMSRHASQTSSGQSSLLWFHVSGLPNSESTPRSRSSSTMRAASSSVAPSPNISAST